MSLVLAKSTPEQSYISNIPKDFNISYPMFVCEQTTALPEPIIKLRDTESLAYEPIISHSPVVGSNQTVGSDV